MLAWCTPSPQQGPTYSLALASVFVLFTSKASKLSSAPQSHSKAPPQSTDAYAAFAKSRVFVLHPYLFSEHRAPYIERQRNACHRCGFSFFFLAT